MNAPAFSLTYRLPGDGRRITLTAPENEDVALTVWDTGSRRTVTLTAKKAILLEDYRESGHPFLEKTRAGVRDNLYFLNGYQSWTDTREAFASEAERDVTRLPRALVNAFAFDRYGDASFFPYDRKILHGYDVFYVRGKIEAFLFSRNARFAYLVAVLDRKTGTVTLASDVNGGAVGADP